MNPVPNDLLVPMFRDARDMLLLTWAGVRAPSAAALDTAAALGRSIHKAEKELTERLVAGSNESAPLRLVPAHVERIGDAIDGLIRACQLLEVEGTCRPASSSAYLGILDYLREITRHARLIAGRIAPRSAPGEGPFFRI